MKKIFIVLLLIVSSQCFAQFGLSTSAGYGISINSRFEYSLFQSVITVTPQYKINKFTFGAQSNAVNTDSTTTMFNGAVISYDAYKIDNDKSVSISGHYLLGFEGDFLYGGGVSYNVGAVGFDLTLSGEYNRKELWVIAGVRYNLIY